MIRAAILAAGLLVAAGAAAAEPAVVALRAADAARDWRSVGAVAIDGRATCTGTLIAPAIVLTAARCLPAHVAPSRVTFAAGLRLGRAEAHRGVARIVRHPGTDARRSGATGRIAHDLALLALASPIRLGHVTPVPSGGVAVAGHAVAVVGYPDGGDAPSLVTGCPVVSRDRDVISIGCDLGLPGAPVLVADGSGWRLAAVAVAPATRDGRRVALAAGLDRGLDDLLRALSVGERPAAVGRRVAVGTPSTLTMAARRR